MSISARDAARTRVDSGGADLVDLSHRIHAHPEIGHQEVEASKRLSGLLQSAGIPVVGVYETMPTPGYNYQTWMLAEVAAISAAVHHGTSTEHL